MPRSSRRCPCWWPASWLSWRYWLRLSPDYDQRIAASFSSQPDAAMFRIAARRGTQLAPRVCGGYGPDRTRYKSALQLQQYQRHRTGPGAKRPTPRSLIGAGTAQRSCARASMSLPVALCRKAGGPRPITMSKSHRGKPRHRVLPGTGIQVATNHVPLLAKPRTLRRGTLHCRAPSAPLTTTLPGSTQPASPRLIPPHSSLLRTCSDVSGPPACSGHSTRVDGLPRASPLAQVPQFKKSDYWNVMIYGF